MATLAAQVTATGIAAPSYPDILQQLRIDYWALYGSDADLDPDSQDGQFLAIFAKAIDDANQLAIAVFNAFSPATAFGAGLARVVKINGIVKHEATNSQVIVTIGGVAGTTILNGIVGDNQGLGTRWLLPPEVTIPVTGTIDVTATAEAIGSTTANPNTLTVKLTPTLGWQTVNNVAAATAGEPIETDAQLRIRQAISTALPALTVLESLFGAIAAVPGVTRLTVYENDTDIVDAEGVPPHSISPVVEGGNINEVAAAIAAKKAPGVGTYGTTAVTVVDSHGVPNVIRFYALTEVSMTVQVDITAQPGYLSTTGETLRKAIVDFLNAAKIGEDSYLARLYTPANQGGMGTGATYVVTAIRQSRDGNPPAAANVAIAFNEATIAVLANVALNVT